MVYLDNSATTQVCPAAAAKAAELMTTCFGNPSSLHTLGFLAEQELTAARGKVTALFSAKAEEVVFTSGGTEANNLAILGAAAARARRGKHVITAQTEHPSVLAAFERLEQQGFEVTRVAPQADGSIAPRDVLAACRPDTVLVSLMAVNNETGAMFPWEQVGAKIRAAAPLAALHCDAVQAAGKTPLSMPRASLDLVSCSGHKLHAPKGVGALLIKKGTRLVPPAALGGGQEKGIRSGTENTPAIAAFGAAVAALPTPAVQTAHYEVLQSALLDALRDLPDIALHLPERGVPYIVHLSALGRKSETLVHFLAGQQIYVSGGSACAKGNRSHVLSAMGLPPAHIDSSLRVSFSMQNSVEDVQAFAAALRVALATLAHT